MEAEILNRIHLCIGRRNFSICHLCCQTPNRRLSHLWTTNSVWRQRMKRLYIRRAIQWHELHSTCVLIATVPLFTLALDALLLRYCLREDIQRPWIGCSMQSPEIIFIQNTQTPPPWRQQSGVKDAKSSVRPKSQQMIPRSRSLQIRSQISRWCSFSRQSKYRYTVSELTLYASN